jgi:SAM-dependent methyltransferase
MSETFDADWLLLREPFDHAAFSLALAGRLASLLPARPRLLDLGAGTGSLFRILAPVIGRAQAWTLVDADEDLLGEAFGSIADWGESQGWTVTWPGRALLLHTPTGAWRVEGLVTDLRDTPAGLPLLQADAVVCSALLDLVSGAWLARLASGLRSPFLACLSIDGRDAWLPRDRADALVMAGFRRHQSRDKGFGSALGVRAPLTASRILAAQGFEVTSAPSDWWVPRSATEMLAQLTQQTVQAARAAKPAYGAAIDAWETRRLRQATMRRLAIQIGHRDVLAIPPK